MEKKAYKKVIKRFGVLYDCFFTLAYPPFPVLAARIAGPCPLSDCLVIPVAVPDSRIHGSCHFTSHACDYFLAGTGSAGLIFALLLLGTTHRTECA